MFKKFLALVLTLCFMAGAAFAAAVDVNKATQAELEAVKGIGPTTSTKILDERKKGDFKDWPDLIARVKGIGEAKAGKLSTEGLNVNGAAYTAPAKSSDKKAAAKASDKAASVSAPAASAAKADDKPAAKSDKKKADKPSAAASK